MFKVLYFPLAVAVIAFGVIATTALDAHSAIRCNGPYQIQKNGNEISTPYCEDNYLAKVAREFGFRVSSAKIRNNPSVKREVCSLMGFDPRVRHNCTGYRSDDRGGGR